MNYLTKKYINHRIIRVLQSNLMPWQKPWMGWSKNQGFPCNIISKKKYSGINFILLQMAAKQHKLASKWWGTVNDFKSLGYTVAERPSHVEAGTWGTEIVNGENTEVVYNSGQLIEKFSVEVNMNPDYSFADRVLFNTPVRIETNDKGIAEYHYPPDNYITMPSKSFFEEGLFGLPAYYECLAHELMHYSEGRMHLKGYKLGVNDYFAPRELRAEIGSAMLAQELNFPHSYSFYNFRKWGTSWINFINRYDDLIFEVAESASKGVESILKFSEGQCSK